MQETFTANGESAKIPVKAGETLRYYITGFGTAMVTPKAFIESTWVPVAEGVTADMTVAKVLDAPTGRRTMYRFEVTGYASGSILIIAD